MNTTIITTHTTNALNTMFDQYFQISVFTDRPGQARPDDELYVIDGMTIRLKHWATYLAIVNEESGFNLQTWDYNEVLRAFLQSLQENAILMMSILEKGYEILMERVVAQN